MKKLFVLTLVLAVAIMFASPAMATKSRLTAMGGVDNYIEDDYNIFNWPATLPSYANILTIELINDDYYHWSFAPSPSQGDYNDAGWYGNSVSAMFGLIKGLGEDNQYGALGLFLMEVAPGLNPWSDEIEGLWDDAALFSWPVYNKFTLMYGYAMDGLSFGLGFSRSDEGATEEWEGFDGEIHWAYTTLSAGVRFDIGDKAYGDVAFDYSMASYTEKPTSWGEISEDANSMYGIKARVFYDWNDYLTIIPYFGLKMWNFSLQADSTGYFDECYGSKGLSIDFGIGTDWTVNDENTIIVAIEPYSYTKLEPSECEAGYEIQGTMTTIPRFLLALESEITDWLTLRTGCIKELNKIEMKSAYEDSEYKMTYTEACFDWFFGFGFDIADFEFDCVVHEQVPFSLGYWLTGYQPDTDEETPVWMISAKYHF